MRVHLTPPNLKILLQIDCHTPPAKKWGWQVWEFNERNTVPVKVTCWLFVVHTIRLMPSIWLFDSRSFAFFPIRITSQKIRQNLLYRYPNLYSSHKWTDKWRSGGQSVYSVRSMYNRLDLNNWLLDFFSILFVIWISTTLLMKINLIALWSWILSWQ